jgi:hypothetical protein
MPSDRGRPVTVVAATAISGGFPGLRLISSRRKQVASVGGGGTDEIGQVHFLSEVMVLHIRNLSQQKRFATGTQERVRPAPAGNPPIGTEGRNLFNLTDTGMREIFPGQSAALES